MKLIIKLIKFLKFRVKIKKIITFRNNKKKYRKIKN